MSLRILIMALGVTVTLSACSFDRMLGKDASAATASTASGTAGSGATASPSVSRDKALGAAAKAVGAEVVVKPGQYLLCRSTDAYKDRTTYYYTCREHRCVGQESAATDIKAPTTKSGCLSTCRSLEKQRKSGAPKAYCAS